LRANETTERARAEALFKKEEQMREGEKAMAESRRRNKRSEKRLPGFARGAWRAMLPNRAGLVLRVCTGRNAAYEPITGIADCCARAATAHAAAPPSR
jgi:hypothetical protein